MAARREAEAGRREGLWGMEMESIRLLLSLKVIVHRPGSIP